VRHQLREIIVGRLTSPIFESNEKLWPDEGGDTWYPHRFEFEVIHREQNIDLGSGELGPSLAEALRLSAIQRGGGYLVPVEGTLFGRLGLATRPTGTPSPAPQASLQATFERILSLQDHWASTNTEEMEERGLLIRDRGPAVLRSWLPKDVSPPLEDLAVEGRDGTGLKTRVPWTRVHSKSRSPRATEGWYLVYLFAYDGSAVFLSLNQGTTNFENGDFRRKNPEMLVAGAQRYRDLVDRLQLRPPSFSADMRLADSGELGDGYELGNVCAVRYEAGRVPDDGQLRADLDAGLKMLAEVYKFGDTDAATATLPQLLRDVVMLQPSWSKAVTPAMTNRAKLVTESIPIALRAHVPSGREIKGSGGVGSPARIPWVRIFSPAQSPNATSGWYLVYLFAADGSTVYLSLNQGTADPTRTSEGVPSGYKSKPPAEVQARARAAISLLEERSAVPAGTQRTIRLADPSGRGDDYERGNVFAFAYPATAIPPTEQLAADLDQALHALETLYQLFSVSENETEDKPNAEEPVIVVRPEFDIFLLRHHVAQRRLIIEDGILLALLAALNSGKHVILTGPPGTAKTTLAEAVACAAEDAGLCAGHTLTTATSDWTTFETVGGLRPNAYGTLEFAPGQFVKAIRENRWLVVDELNRSNFDRAFGQLFTLLSGQSVSLPYEDAETGKPICLAAEGTPGALDRSQAVTVLPKSWRLLATMNVFDKSLLFEMSFALMRRFAFIEVNAPIDSVYRQIINNELDGVSPVDTEIIVGTLDILLTLRSIKELGPALFVDMARFARERLAIGDIGGSSLLYQLFYSYLLPQFEGIEDGTGEKLFRALAPLVGKQRSKLHSDLQLVLGVSLAPLKTSSTSVATTEDLDEIDELDDVDGTDAIAFDEDEIV
jgi:MoxR-like ATPase